MASPSLTLDWLITRPYRELVIPTSLGALGGPGLREKGANGVLRPISCCRSAGGAPSRSSSRWTGAHRCLRVRRAWARCGWCRSCARRQLHVSSADVIVAEQSCGGLAARVLSCRSRRGSSWRRADEHAPVIRSARRPGVRRVPAGDPLGGYLFAPSAIVRRCPALRQC